jgi:ATP-binding cassette, subfamily C (CFTR/MRP), member 1
VPSAALSLVSALSLVILVGLEHGRSVRPGTIILVYLLASIIAEAVQIRTLYLRHYVVEIARLLCASLACKVLLIVLESWSKKSALIQTEYDYSPEELAGIFNRSTFGWLNPILYLGNRKILAVTDLYPLNSSFRSEGIQARILAAWEKRT